MCDNDTCADIELEKIVPSPLPVPSDGGGFILVTELPETGNPNMLYVLVDDESNPTKVFGTYFYKDGWVSASVAPQIEVVDTLPDEGEEGVIYYLKKSGTDAYDLYEWVDNAWRKLDVDITLYPSTGQNTDGAMTQKAVTDELEGKLPTNAKLWNQSYDATNNRFQGELRVLASKTQYGGSGRVLSIVPSLGSGDYYPNRWYGEFWNELSWGTGVNSLFYRTTNYNDGFEMKNVFRFGYVNGHTSPGTIQSDNKSYTPFDMTNFKIYNLADPTGPQDSANKRYVDTAVASAGAVAFPTETFNSILEEA